MSVRLRSYRHPADFNRVGQFLIDTYRPRTYHDNWLQPRWEYMHYHPQLDRLGESALAKIGVWESDGKIVAVAHFESMMGEAYFQIHPDFTYLKPEMLEYAEAHLSVEADNGQRQISVWVNDFDTEFESIVKSSGYRIVDGVSDCWSVFEITHPFPPIDLPDGFRLQSLEEENDLWKLSRVIHRGFNHPGEPPQDWLAEREKMQSAPNYRKDLNIVAVAPNGSYASYCGMWHDTVHRVAYVEPVCTDPDYRRIGVGRAVVLEGIRRCGQEGATVAFVGSEQPFYLSMGFKKLFGINLWTRQWET
ncbi:MAG: GNAT family N-acetyltransferase [Dehalococcoidales bacterium]|nr:MAG: GNAT family N-acetyltransferase [Dehalococcoidales bacterium]